MIDSLLHISVPADDRVLSYLLWFCGSSHSFHHLSPLSNIMLGDHYFPDAFHFSPLITVSLFHFEEMTPATLFRSLRRPTLARGAGVRLFMTSSVSRPSPAAPLLPLMNPLMLFWPLLRVLMSSELGHLKLATGPTRSRDGH